MIVQAVFKTDRIDDVALEALRKLLGGHGTVLEVRRLEPDGELLVERLDPLETMRVVDWKAFHR